MKKITKIAIPVIDHQISETFEQTYTFMIYTVFHEVILKEKLIRMEESEPKAKAIILKENGVSEVLARKMDLSTIELLNKMKINVFIGVKGHDADWIIHEYMQGKLTTNDSIIEKK